MKDFSEKKMGMDCKLGNFETNCLPGWAPVLTPEGYKFLCNLKNKVYIHGKEADCSDIIKKNKEMGVYEVKLECGIPAFMTLTHKIAVQNGDKSLEELKPGDVIKTHFIDIIKSKKLDTNLVRNGFSAWDDFNQEIDVIMQSLDLEFSYQAGVVIGAILKAGENIDNLLCISRTAFNEPTLQMLQILMSEFGIYSHLDDKKLIIITINSLDILAKKLEYDSELNKLFSQHKLTNISTPNFYVPKLMEQQKITDITFHSNDTVYDIQVPKINHFVTSGIVVHNCNN